MLCAFVNGIAIIIIFIFIRKGAIPWLILPHREPDRVSILVINVLPVRAEEALVVVILAGMAACPAGLAFGLSVTTGQWTGT